MKRFLFFLLLIILSHRGGAQSFSPPVGIAVSTGAGSWNMTPAAACTGAYLASAIWATTPVDFNNAFTLTFQMSDDIVLGSGADGICVAFGQNLTATSVNGTAGYLGYYNADTSAPNAQFLQSFAVEFDIFNDYPIVNDPSGLPDHTMISRDGNPYHTTPGGAPVQIRPSGAGIKDGLYHNYTIHWCPDSTRLQVYYEDTLRLTSVFDYRTVFSGTAIVNWGITSGIGSSCSDQLIRNIVLTPGTCSPSSACLTNSLIINTGYNPITTVAIPGGANGAPAVPDPHWTLTAVSPGVAAAIAVTPITGLVEVAPGASADVITNVGAWAVNPAGNPGGWISCLNSNTYYTSGTGTIPYNMTLGRSFRMCSDDSIKITFYVANDNYIPATNIDGVPLGFSQPAIASTTFYSTYAFYTQTVFLTAGTHTFNVEVADYDDATTDGSNPTGLDLYGTVASASGLNSLVSESSASCAAYVCETVCNTLTMPDSVHLCPGDTSTLYAVMSGPDSIISYAWSPATGLSSTTILDPVVTAITSGWYYLTVQSVLPFNLVVNGDFSAGNTGFTSSYTYSPPPSTTLVEGDYSVYTDPHGVHTGFTTMGDHTTGTGNMMIINGGPTASSVWCETVPVTPNTNYDFSAWFADCSSVTVGVDVPILQFMVNGVLLGTPTSVTAPPGTWVNFFSTWNSGISTSATICIYDETTAASGNDFVIDDISFNQICVALDSEYVKINTPDTTYGSRDTSVCATVGPITLTGPGGYAGHVWSTGATTATITVDTNGTYWVVDSNSCAIFIDTFHVTFVVPDTATTHVLDTVCASLGSLTLSAPAGFVSPVWSTGATTSTIVVTAAGSYWVLYTSNCATSVDTFDVFFKASPVITLGNDTAFCQGDSVILMSVQPAGDTYLWSTGATGDSIHVSVSGTYSLTVSNGCPATASITITVSPHPLVNLGPDVRECDGQAVVLQSSYTYVSPTYLWSNATSGATTTVTATGTYWLQVTVDGCSGADTVNVTILYDTLTLFNHDTAICKGNAVQVLTTGTALQTYLWTPTAGIAFPTSGSPLITPDTSATYTLTVYYPGCPNLVDSFHIDVQPVPQVYLGGNRQVCEYDTLHITASVNPTWYMGYTYAWSPAVSLDNSGTATVVFTAGDSTNIILTVTTPAGCIGVDSAEIIVHPGNFVNFDSSFAVCPGDSVQLFPVANPGPATYVWHPAMYLTDSTSSAPWVHPITSQYYWAVATNQYGCLDTVSANITVRSNAVLYLPDSITLYPGESYQLSPQTNCTSFEWTPPGGLSDAYISNPVATPEISTKYVVYGYTEWGCKTKDSINIYVDAESLIALPNAFTPGNGVNTLFKVLLRGEATLNYFRIYNRWGNLVFTTSDISAGWDGTFHGQPQPYDVYVYEIEAVTSTGTVFHKAGNVTLIR